MGIFDKSGDITVYGRNLHWKATGYLKGLSWRYKATVTDKASGVSGSASNFKSGKGAVEHATAECFKAMIAKGIITPPPTTTTTLTSLDEASLNAPEDPQQPLQQQEQQQPQQQEQTQQEQPQQEQTQELPQQEQTVKEVKQEEEKEEITEEAETTEETTPVVELEEVPVVIVEVEVEDDGQGEDKGNDDTNVINVMNSKALTNEIKDALSSSSQEFYSVYTVTSIDSDGETVQGGTDKSGDIVVYGRQVHWQASGGLKGLKWVYKATATDVASGVSGSASGKQSGQGAVEWAVKDLFQKLISQGIIIVPSAISHEQSTYYSSSSRPSPLSLISPLEESPLSMLFSRLVQPRTTSVSPNDNPFQALFSSISRFADVMDGFHSMLTSKSKSLSYSKKDNDRQSVQGIFDKSGDTVIYGRKFHWKATGYLKGLSWRYKADATDVTTGVQGHASGLKSGQGAVENAVKDCFQKLIAGGYIVIPPQ